MIIEEPMVIQSNTNLNPKLLTEYFKACVKYNYKVRCVLPINDLLYYDGPDIDTRSKQVRKNLIGSFFRYTYYTRRYTMIND